MTLASKILKFLIFQICQGRLAIFQAFSDSGHWVRQWRINFTVASQRLQIGFTIWILECNLSLTDFSFSALFRQKFNWCMVELKGQRISRGNRVAFILLFTPVKR
ncbi:uncharacterized protein [Arachis hypogaea]|uniref:uncharacterized protein n=1 Tax=Arachis hypogaea TaxID=3818 RepID=UPI003B228330